MRHSSGTPSHFKLLAMLRSVRVPSGSPTELMRLRGSATGWLGPLPSRVITQNATPIAGAGRIAGIPIRSRGFIAGNRDQKLLAHLGESGTAIFPVKQVEYNGHDRTLAWSSLLTALPSLSGISPAAEVEQSQRNLFLMQSDCCLVRKVRSDFAIRRSDIHALQVDRIPRGSLSSIRTP